MTPRLITILLATCDILFNPRSNRDPAYCQSLGENIRAIGQQVPIIGYYRDDRFIVVDGGCRVEGMKMNGLTEVLAHDLGKEPSELDLKTAQFCIDIHKQHLPPMDRARLIDDLLKVRGCTGRELARDMSVSESTITNHRHLLNLTPELQEKVNSGTLDWTKAIYIGREPDPARQQELATLAATMSRDELAASCRKKQQNSKSTATAKLNRIHCPMPLGTITISGQGLTLEDAIKVLVELLKLMREASKDNLDAKTFSAVCAQKAKKTGEDKTDV